MFNKHRTKMEIRKEILDKIRFDPILFADVLKAVNSGRKKIMQDTLQRRLQRYSENVRSNHSIIECLKSKGFTEEEIFEFESVSK